MATTHITHTAEGTTIVRVVLSEEDLRNATVIVEARRENDAETDHLVQVETREEVYTDEDGNEEVDGTLYLNAWECANPDGGQVENHYPEYFTVK